MAKSTQLKYLAYTAWLLGMLSFSMVVYAAENDKFATGMDAIPFGALKYVLYLVLLSGVLSTLVKLCKPNPPIVRSLTLEIAKDAVGSLAAGVVAYLFTSWVDSAITPVNFLAQAIIIFFAGYGGSRWIESAYEDGFLAWTKGIIRRVLSRQEPPPPPVDGQGGNQ